MLKVQAYYRDHFISARAERDPQTGLFKPVIAIKQVICADETGRMLRQPEDGVFSTAHAAEQFGIIAGQEFIDRIVARTGARVADERLCRIADNGSGTESRPDPQHRAIQVRACLDEWIRADAMHGLQLRRSSSGVSTTKR